MKYKPVFVICAPDVPSDPLESMVYTLDKWMAICEFHMCCPNHILYSKKIDLARSVPRDRALCLLYEDGNCSGCPVMSLLSRKCDREHDAYVLCEHSEKTKYATAMLLLFVDSARLVYPDHDWDKYVSFYYRCTNQQHAARDESELHHKLADYAHRAWSGWMEYLFGKCIALDDGSVVIPKHFVDRWERQIRTDYYDLSQREQNSDLKEARAIIEVLDRLEVP